MTTDIGTKTLDGKEQPLPKGLWGNHILTHRDRNLDSSESILKDPR